MLKDRQHRMGGVGRTDRTLRFLRFWSAPACARFVWLMYRAVAWTHHDPATEPSRRPACCWVVLLVVLSMEIHRERRIPEPCHQEVPQPSGPTRHGPLRGSRPRRRPRAHPLIRQAFDRGRSGGPTSACCCQPRRRRRSAAQSRDPASVALLAARRCGRHSSSSIRARSQGGSVVGWPRAVAYPRLPQIRTCPIRASGSSDDGFAASSHPTPLSCVVASR